MPVPILLAFGVATIFGLLSVSCESSKKEPKKDPEAPASASGSSSAPPPPSPFPPLRPFMKFPKVLADGGAPTLKRQGLAERLSGYGQLLSFNKGEPSASSLDLLKTHAKNEASAKAFLKSEGYRIFLRQTFAESGSLSVKSLFEGIAESMISPEASGQRFIIEGHTASDGSSEANAELSRRWSETIGLLLQMHGVPSQSLVTKGYGEEQPLMPEVGPSAVSAKLKNKRIEIKIESE